MKKTVVVLVVLLIVKLNAESFSFESPAGNFKFSVDEVSKNANTNSSLADEIAQRVEYLQTKYLEKLNAYDQKKSAKVIDQIYELLTLIPDDIYVSQEKTEQAESSDVNVNIELSGMQQNEQTNNQPILQEKPVEKKQTAMNNSEFNDLLQNVENESFADDQLAVIRIAVKSKHFTIEQLIRLIDIFSFSEEKISCVRLVYPKVIDKENAHNLLSAFTYSDDKQQVEKIIDE